MIGLMLTLLKPSQLVVVPAVPSHLLTVALIEHWPSSGLIFLLGLQPSGLSDTPLYREISPRGSAPNEELMVED
jgi:hypothetical protein